MKGTGLFLVLFTLSVCWCRVTVTAMRRVSPEGGGLGCPTTTAHGAGASSLKVAQGLELLADLLVDLAG
jgi:hypothetical protein